MHSPMFGVTVLVIGLKLEHCVTLKLPTNLQPVKTKTYTSVKQRRKTSNRYATLRWARMFLFSVFSFCIFEVEGVNT